MTIPVRVLGLVLLAGLGVVSPFAVGQAGQGEGMSARADALGGQVVLREGDRAIVQYNARTVDVPEGYLDGVAEGNRQYAKPRSGYIHPLYGPDGESLTLDWSIDHPHHRGIYWAWPEVQFGVEIRDLHALQGVYSRPVGEPSMAESDTFARVEARNLWLWEDRTPIVYEQVVITAHARGEDGVQAVDLDVRFEALADGVTLARRGTDLYGGLNTRLAPIADLELQRYGDAEDAQPRRAWSLGRGVWEGGQRPVTLVVLEHSGNADYPGDWISYPELPWFQPAFPKAGTRYAIERGDLLVLRYRFLVIPGTPTAEFLGEAFDVYVGAAVNATQDGADSNVAHGEERE